MQAPVRATMVCALAAVLLACQVTETAETDGAPLDTAGAPAVTQATTPPADVPCTEPRQSVSPASSSEADSVVTPYAKLIYPAGAYNGSQPVQIRPHPTFHGVQVVPPPAQPSQLWINYAMCPGPGNPLYYFRTSTGVHAVRRIDDTWVAGVVVRGDFASDAPLQAGLLPPFPLLQDTTTADTSSILSGFVILSN